MRLINKILTISLFIIGLCNSSVAEEFSPFQGEVNTDNINIRSDSTINSGIICKVNKGDRVEVISQFYDWYRIKLPQTAPSFIKKDLVVIIDAKTAMPSITQEVNIKPEQKAKVLKERVNIRLYPNESSLIIAKADKDQIVNIIGILGEWYKIAPLENSFGWIHKKFVNGAYSGLKPEAPFLLAPFFGGGRNPDRLHPLTLKTAVLKRRDKIV